MTTNYHRTFITVSPDIPVTFAALQLQLLLVEERSGFDAKAKACLRASPPAKTHGSGLLHDSQGRVAAIEVDDPAYFASPRSSAQGDYGHERSPGREAAIPKSSMSRIETRRVRAQA